MIAENGGNLVFIGGMPRSGTTWLANLFGSLPRTVSGRELHLFGNFVSKLVASYHHESNYGAPDGISPLIGLQQFFTGQVRPLSDSILETYAAAAAKSRDLELGGHGLRIVEKTPSNALHWKLIKELYPESALVFIVRDPRAVAASFKAAAAQPWGGWARRPVGEIAISWLRYYASVCAAMDAGCAYVIRYENLVADPAGELGAAFMSIGVDIDDGAIESILAQNSIERLASASPDDWRHDSRESFYRNGRVDGWRAELSDSEISEIAYLCGGVSELRA